MGHCESVALSHGLSHGTAAGPPGIFNLQSSGSRWTVAGQLLTVLLTRRHHTDLPMPRYPTAGPR